MAKGYCNLFCKNGHRRSAETTYLSCGQRNCRECINAWTRKNRLEIPEHYRERDRLARILRYDHNRILERAVLLKKFGLTLADYDRIFAEQNGRCAICRREQKQCLSVDHDHATGRVRGLLCTRCNLALGFYEKYLSDVQKYMEVK